MVITEKSFYLTSGGRDVAASIVMPEKCRAVMLIAMPLVEERKSVLLPVVEAARHFAETCSVAVLRIDYSGTGDSWGNFQDCSPADWIADMESAAEWLRGIVPEVPFLCLGIRTGALLLAASDNERIRKAGKIYWDPVGGSEVIHQWLQRHMVNDMLAYGKARESRSAIEARLKEGESADLDGFELTGKQYAELSSMQFRTAESRTLVITSGRLSAEIRNWSLINAGSIENKELKLPPYWSSVGYVDTEALRGVTAEWISRNTGNDGGNSIILPEVRDKNALGERVICIQSGCDTVRGVLTLPDGGIKRTVLFLGGWSGDRQGPHRLFLQYARILSCRGSVSLRIDYRGRGESGLDHNSAGIESMADDAECAVAWLRREGFAPNGVDVIAICSGCKVAITLATRTEITHMDLLSAEAMGHLRAGETNTLKTLSALKAYGRKLIRKDTWCKIFKGEVRTDMVGKALVKHETRSAEEAKAENAVLTSFGKLRKFSGTLSFVYGGSDPDARAAMAAYRKYCGKNAIRASFDMIPSAGHSYYSAEWTGRLFSLLDR